jgi:protein-S-isoprenylcysteine O-methyltransferase Ste14
MEPQNTAPEVEPSRIIIAGKSWLSRSRAWISILMLVPAGILAAFSLPYLPENGCVLLGLEGVGWGLFLMGAFSRWWATCTSAAENKLICEGPYSITRNPLYFGTFLMTLSIAVMIQSLIFAVAVLASTVLYLAVTVPREERRLSWKNEEAFAAYRNRVPMFLPRISLYQSPREILVRTDGLRAELIRSLRWVWVPFLCHVFVHLRMQSWWPHVLRLP